MDPKDTLECVAGTWYEASAALRQELKETLDADRLRQLHEISAGKHALVAIRQFLLAAVAALLIFRFEGLWYVW